MNTITLGATRAIKNTHICRLSPGPSKFNTPKGASWDMSCDQIMASSAVISCLKDRSLEVLAGTLSRDLAIATGAAPAPKAKVEPIPEPVKEEAKPEPVVEKVAEPVEEVLPKTDKAEEKPVEEPVVTEAEPVVEDKPEPVKEEAPAEEKKPAKKAAKKKSSKKSVKEDSAE